MAKNVTSAELQGPPRRGRAREHLLAKKASPRGGKDSGPRGEAKAAPDRAAAAAPSAAVVAWEKALATFHRRDWAKAAEQLRKVVADHATAHPTLADTARTYVRVCERELAPARAVAKTAEDCYKLGILRFNEGAADESVAHLEQALKIEVGSDKAHYALAAALLLKKDSARALESLRRAIEINTENRVLASNDSDFDALRESDEFAALVAAPRRRRQPVAVAAPSLDNEHE